MPGDVSAEVQRWRERFPEKFVYTDKAFSCIRRGGRIFVGTGCGEPARSS